MIEFINLTEENMARFMPDLIKLEHEIFGPELGWAEGNFRLDLPRKAELSFICLLDGEPVGFRISSAYFLDGVETGHAHHIGVTPKHRGKSLGLVINQHTIDLCRQAGLTQLTCETSSIFPADEFHVKGGFRKMTEQELLHYLEARGRPHRLAAYRDGRATAWIQFI